MRIAHSTNFVLFHSYQLIVITFRRKSILENFYLKEYGIL